MLPHNPIRGEEYLEVSRLRLAQRKYTRNRHSGALEYVKGCFRSIEKISRRIEKIMLTVRPFLTRCFLGFAI